MAPLRPRRTPSGPGGRGPARNPGPGGRPGKAMRPGGPTGGPGPIRPMGRPGFDRRNLTEGGGAPGRFDRPARPQGGPGGRPFGGPGRPPQGGPDRGPSRPYGRDQDRGPRSDGPGGQGGYGGPRQGAGRPFGSRPPRPEGGRFERGGPPQGGGRFERGDGPPRGGRPFGAGRPQGGPPRGDRPPGRGFEGRPSGPSRGFGDRPPGRGFEGRPSGPGRDRDMGRDRPPYRDDARRGGDQGRPSFGGGGQRDPGRSFGPYRGPNRDRDQPRDQGRERGRDQGREGRDEGRPAGRPFRPGGGQGRGIAPGQGMGPSRSFTGNAIRRTRDRIIDKTSGGGGGGRGSSGEYAHRGPAQDDHEPDGSIRLNRFIAHSGVSSRREADEIIQQGRVSINGKVVQELGVKVMPNDQVRLDGRLLTRERPVYILMNKPKDYITTSDDPEGRRTVLDLLGQAINERVYPVGRLDRNTTGLLILTNDGDLADRLMHPSFEIRKVYQVELDRPVSSGDIERIRQGVILEDGKASVDDVAIVSPDGRVVGIELHIGRNRIVRRIFESLGYQVRFLDRVMYGGLTKKDLPRGRWRHMTPQEVINLKHLSS